MSQILQNELFDAFANAAENIYIFVCDMRSDLSRWSKNAVDYFGLPGEYMENAAMKWLNQIHPDDQALYLQDINSVFSGDSMRHYCQYRAKNIYGDYVWLECRGSVITDKNHEPKIFAGMMTRLDTQNKYDSLTHLLTGHEFQKYDFHNQQGTIHLLGIDDFRKIINNYGHDYGDAILVEFAARLEKLMSEGRLVYRFHGDEFIIVSPHREKEDAKKLTKQISLFCQNLGKKTHHPIDITVSIGIAEYPKDGDDHESLLSSLEHSLEHAKCQNHCEPVFFSPELALRHNRIFLMREMLTRSIRNNFEGFELYYQPLITYNTHQINGCEALLRWSCPEIPDVSTLEIIKSLESSGEIREVGNWVMEQVFRKAKKWQKRYGLFLGFNTSYLQFTDDTFTNRVISEANRQGIDQHHIVIELTESSALSNPSTLSGYFRLLQENGFCIALDDFGTAYSSLSLLHTIPADLIKLDHGFISGLSSETSRTDMAIIESVVSMCNKLSIGVVVEGIESREIEDIILNLNVNLLQGYLYSMPVSETDFERLLDKGYLAL